MTTPVESDTTSGRFRLLTRLGSGGMGDVYLALARGPAGFQKLLVLKFLREDLQADHGEELLRMFENEARIAARLNHPHVVQCHEVAFDQGRPYLAMEYLDGQPLSRIQRRAQQGAAGWTLEMRLLVLAQVLEGLEYAHGLSDFDGSPLQVVHRDVSPDNVFVTYAGQVKLVDFGIAKTLHSHRTSTGVIKGKLEYMAPEQVHGDSVDARTDLYAVGVMLWEAVVDAPMHGPSMPPYQIMQRVVQGDLPSLLEVCPDVDPAIAAIADQALALRPEDRFQSATEMRVSLGAVMERMNRVESRNVGAWVAAAFSVERAGISEVIRRASAEDDDGALSSMLDPAAVDPTSPTRLAQGTGIDATPATRLVRESADEVVAAEPYLALERVVQSEPPAPGGALTDGRGDARVGLRSFGVVVLLLLVAAGAFVLASRPDDGTRSADLAQPAEKLPRASTPTAVQPQAPDLAQPADNSADISLGADSGAGVESESDPGSAGPGPDTHMHAVAPEDSEPAGINVQVRTEPARAELQLNGKPVDNPYQGIHQAGEQLHFRAARRGYRGASWSAELGERALALGEVANTLTLPPASKAPAASAAQTLKTKAPEAKQPSRKKASEQSPPQASKPQESSSKPQSDDPYPEFELEP